MLVLAVALAAGGLTGCDRGAADDVPPPESPSVTPPPSPDESPSAWESEYTDKQIATYEEALGRWNDYRTRSEPIWARGKANKASEELFKQYFYAWQVKQAELRTFEENGITLEGHSTVLWSRPARVEGDAVTIEQCVDPAAGTAKVFQDGQELPPSGSDPDHPFISKINLSRPQGGGAFLIEPGERVTREDAVRCEE